MNRTSDHRFYPLGDDRYPVGDVMPCYDAASGTFTIYYLKGIWNNALHQRHPWYGLKTADFTAYAGLPAGEILGCSTEGCEQDFALGTGCVIRRGDITYAFYTGHNPNYPSECVRRREGVLLATSPDRNRRFTKQRSFATLYPPARQGFDENDNFRDPFVIYDPGSATYTLIAAARKNVGGAWRGVVVKYASADLLRWTYGGVLYDGGPTNFFMMETPELFRMGGVYYLLFSDIDSRNLYYRKSASLHGPWSSPDGSERFEGNGLYAARTAVDAHGDRYLFGWIGRLAGDRDDGLRNWGGNLVVHRLYQKGNRDLAVTIPRTLKSTVEVHSEPLVRRSRRGRVTNPVPNVHTYTLRSPADKQIAGVLFHPVRQIRYKIHALVSYRNAAGDFGFMIGARDDTEDFYSLRFVPARNRFRLDKGKRSALTPARVADADVPFPMRPNTEYSVDIVMENSVVVAYLDNVAALTARIYRAPGASWGIFADNATATFQKIRVTRP